MRVLQPKLSCCINNKYVTLTIQFNCFFYFDTSSFSSPFSLFTSYSFPLLFKRSHSCTPDSTESFHPSTILLNHDKARPLRRTWLLNAAITPMSDVETFRVVDANSSLHVCTVFSICTQWDVRYYVVYGVDLVLDDVIWHDMTWHDMTWHNMTWHDMTWHDMTWHDMTWHDMTWQDMTWHDMTWHDMTWHDMT